MSQFFEVHPDNPQLRLFEAGRAGLHGGGVAQCRPIRAIAGVPPRRQGSAENLRRIRGVDDKLC